MDRDDVRTLANEVLTPILGPVGFSYSDVAEREDSVGEDALYVTVHMAPDAEYLPGFRYSDALMAMQDALVDRGERRFAYLKYDFPADPPPSAEDDQDEA
ncbi:MAG: hypothetical protein ACRYGP_08060 [Janthinobacterium lividum]